MSDRVIADYAAAAEVLTARYCDLEPDDLYAGVARFFPPPPAQVLDIGAGPGRDAGWLTAKGHDVTAVEPVAAFRVAGQARFGAGIIWIDDILPDLPTVRARGRAFDLILVSGVWHHLADAAQSRAMRTLSGLLACDGRIILSLRHGPGVPSRPVHRCDPDRTSLHAETQGLDRVHRAEVPSIGQANIAAGIRWAWLVFERAGP